METRTRIEYLCVCVINTNNGIDNYTNWQRHRTVNTKDDMFMYLTSGIYIYNLRFGKVSTNITPPKKHCLF